MKNKIELKKYLLTSFIIIILLTSIFIYINHLEHKKYRENYNKTLAEIIYTVKEKYPNVDNLELINILNGKHKEHNISLNDFGIDTTKEDIILENTKTHNKYLIINICYITTSFIILLILFITYIHKKDKKVLEITELIEKINNKNYSLNIDSNTEDELSILKNELYKTTILLKEQALNEKIDKINLKNSLEDISHQLKTPLTSIMISLDNLIENPKMDKTTKNKFIYSIKREISNIDFLVSTMLKLSKFDANTIKFYEKNSKISDIIKESIANVSLICDLKNIKIKEPDYKNLELKCDLKWQIEAITNILKNAIEHSKPYSEIKINLEQNKIITKILINNKSIIEKKDLPHIFERFYKSSSSLDESVGIGLALSKSIIEKENGKITVTSNQKEGTTFIIKYYKD